jgi:hypothetical protein
MISRVASLTPAFFNRTASPALKAQPAEAQAPVRTRIVSNRPAVARIACIAIPSSPLQAIGESRPGWAE